MFELLFFHLVKTSCLNAELIVAGVLESMVMYVKRFDGVYRNNFEMKTD